MRKRRASHWLLSVSRLCSLIGLVWLAGLLCYFLGAEQWSPWLFLGGIILSVAALGVLLAQLFRDSRRPGDRK